MSFFSELEENLEKYINKLFLITRPGEHLQPVDIARQMGREMRRKRQAGLTGVFVPNRYRIILSQSDYQALEPILERLAGELKEFIAEKAAEKNYELAGLLMIDFIAAAPEWEPPVERLSVEGSFEQQPAAERAAAPERESRHEDTQQFVPLKYPRQQEPSAPRSSRAVLELTAADGRGVEQYVLQGNFTVIGRRETCDICLADAGISRKHAVIARFGSQYVIIDQASSNGTYVNGSRVTRQVLATGDVILLGSTMLAFKVV
ncbi:MAG: DUF3662 and FHA domain-containing protein [Firmicutes bacterium]|nr:DUF3662 and FHA domain-containing protein [Bacillota bacterium]